MLCDDLEGWYGVGRREVQEGSYVYRWLIHFLVQQKHNIIKQLHSNLKKQKQKNFTYLIFRIHFEHFSKKQTKKGKVIMEIKVG